MRHIALLFLLGCSTVSARAQESTIKGAVIDAPTGSETRACKNCPIFVRIPAAPAGMRRMQAVSKYELTWNNYLAAVDAGRCPIPKPYRVGFDAERLRHSNDVVASNLDMFRIDWPIVILSPEDIQCYIGWLQEKIGDRVSLPSEKEWEWFARAGNADARFPWGNEADWRHEALPKSVIAQEDEIAIPDLHDSWAKPIGVRVGLFPPNPWGIYDLLGNVQELTSDVVTGEQVLQRNPASVVARNTRQRDRVVVKGSDRYSRNWEAGISDKSYTMIWDGRYTALTGVRLVLTN